MTLVWRLEGHAPVVEPDHDRWQEWYTETGFQMPRDDIARNPDRLVALSWIDQMKVSISTVFLGQVGAYPEEQSAPLLFESRARGGVFGDRHLEWYDSWDAAMAGHAALVQRCSEG